MHAYKCDRCGIITEESWYSAKPEHKVSKRDESARYLSDYYTDIQLCSSCDKKLKAWLTELKPTTRYKVTVYFKNSRFAPYNSIVFYSITAVSEMEAVKQVEDFIKDSPFFETCKNIKGIRAEVEKEEEEDENDR